MVFVEDRIAGYFQIASMSVNHDKDVVQLNNNKRYSVGCKFLGKGIFARHALFCIRILQQMWTPKTKGKDEAHRIQLNLIWPLIVIFEEKVGKLL